MVINQEKNIENPYGCDVFYFLYLWFEKMEAQNHQLP
jgi:hypothetical protein